MSNRNIKIPRTSDMVIFKAFKDICNKFNITNASISASGFINFSALNLQTPGQEVEYLLSKDAHLIENITIHALGLTIQYIRGGRQTPASLSHDEIELRANPNEAYVNRDRIDLLSILDISLKPFYSTALGSDPISEEMQSLYFIHNDTLRRLENLGEETIRQNLEHRKALQNDFDNKSQERDLELKERKDELESEHHLKLEDLNRKSAELAKKLQDIDDRNNTHVRREIRDRMLSDVKERISTFGVSKTTEKKRQPVFFGMIFLIFAFIVSIGWTIFETAELNKQYLSKLESIRNISSWGPDKIKSLASPEVIAKVSATDVDRSDLRWLWVRLGILTASLLGSIVYYIRWENRWAEQHASSEFNLQQFYIDVNRANWIIESCLEWRKETDSIIPTALLESITNNLFRNPQNEPEQLIHPADELASALLGSASKLKLKLGEHEMEFNKPGKIQKDALAPDK